MSSTKIVTVLLVVTMVAVAGAVPFGLESADCARSKVKPDIDSIQVKNLASTDRSTLANMAGYVEFADNTYLPLDVKSISVGQPDSEGLSVLTFSGKCASFEIRVDYKEYAYSNPMLLVDDDNSGTQKKVCRFNERFWVTGPANERWSCKEVLHHRCMTRQTREHVASLVLKSFEFEINGNQAFVAKGQFTKKPWAETCRIWN
jgi:hypothetical protein